MEKKAVKTIQRTYIEGRDCNFMLPADLGIDSPSVSTRMIATSVKQGHTLVGGSCLQLPEVGAWMRTLGTTFVRRIYSLPRGLLVDDDRLRQLFVEISTRAGYVFYLIDERTRATSKPIACRVCLKSEKIGAIRTK